MIDKTFENAELLLTEAAAARQGKVEALEDMHELARGTAAGRRASAWTTADS